MSLEAFGVKNLRCLTDTGLVPIRPITVLVGRNSSGKSTFLRAFPLLRQSVETARSSPILWYREPGVDFGSFRAAANNKLAEPSVTFQFQVRLPKPYAGTQIILAMSLAGGEDPYVSGYEIGYGTDRWRWELDSKGLATALFENDHVSPLADASMPAGPIGIDGRCALFPGLRVDRQSGVTYSPDAGEVGALALRRRLVELNQPPMFLLAATRSFPALEIADRVIPPLLARVAYLAPLRVSAERAYRVQNLAVGEVDPDGRNLAMFLRALSPDEAASFAAFTNDWLGFETQIRSTGLHAEILVREAPRRSFVNLIDVGFGFSEVLPLAAMLWSSCVRPALHGQAPAPIVAIEQPELHLHPAFQARLARLLVEAQRRAPGTKIVVETHSESLINGLGRLVYEGAIGAEDVKLVLFDQDPESGDTNVTLSGYDSDGALQESWPYGFLSPVAERPFRPAAE